MRGDHLGAIAWGAHGAEALTALGSALDRPTLVILADEEFVWGRFAAAGFDHACWSSVESFPVPEETFLAFGSVGSGPDGFRRTHRQARRACFVANL